MRRYILCSITLMVVATVAMIAQVPRTINYQGRASDASGPIENESRQMTLVIYDDAGGRLWSEVQTVPFRKGGVFSVVIGSVSPIPTSIDFSAPYTLGVTIANFNGGAELPRTPLRSVPYSLHATVADGLKGPATIASNSSDNPTITVIANVASPGNYATFSIGPDSTTAYLGIGGTAPARPNPGAYYRDNAPIAWATVTESGRLVDDFGVLRVVFDNSDQSYRVILANDVVATTGKPTELSMSVSITSGGPNIGQFPPTIAQWGYYADPSDGSISPNTVVVRLYGLSTNEPATAPFSIQVFGRPK